MNTWPGGYRRSMSQSEHESWNASNYPGTRQQCFKCGDPTGRCEDDSLYADNDQETGPLCEGCWERSKQERWEEQESKCVCELKGESDQLVSPCTICPHNIAFEGCPHEYPEGCPMAREVDDE